MKEWQKKALEEKIKEQKEKEAFEPKVIILPKQEEEKLKGTGVI